jgi:tetratricopeptide (TPR) repeat protein
VPKVLMIMKNSIIPAAIIVVAGMVVAATLREAREARDEIVVGPREAPTLTSRAELAKTVERMTARLRAQPGDGRAVVRLADALIRVQRVNNDGAAVVRAEQHLRSFLEREPNHYDAQRMLAAVLLSQHRFADAVRTAQRAQAADPQDPWNFGTIGDGLMELGDYDRAFEAFDRMGQIRPGPSSYARTAFAFELKGDLETALELMRRAAEGTTPNDPEAQAWHYAQAGSLLLQQGRLGDAKREFERAAAAFPDHPYAMSGLARLKIAEGDTAGALNIYRRLLERAPTPELAAAVGDLHSSMGAAADAERLYVLAEALEREGWASEEPQPQALARFLAERDRHIPEAVQLAEAAARARSDIFTMDALAWSYFKAGRLAEAAEAADEALRTGTRDARLLYHAAAIHAARGDRSTARRLLDRMPAPEITFDILAAPAARALKASL